MTVSKNTVQRLLDLKLGDLGRLEHIMETLEKNKPLYRSDERYVTSLISNYLSVSYTEKPQLSQSKLLTEFVNYNLIDGFSKYKSILGSFFNSQRFRFSNLTFFLARFGLAFVFAWSGYSKYTNPLPVADVFSQVAGTSTSFAINVVSAIGVIEAVGAILLLFGFLTRLVTFTQMIILIGGGIVFGMDFVDGPYIWKDVGLLGLVILFFVMGSGKWSLDHLIYKKIQ